MHIIHSYSLNPFKNKYQFKVTEINQGHKVMQRKACQAGFKKKSKLESLSLIRCMTCKN